MSEVKMSEVNEVIYNLENGFEYAFKGDYRTASFITLFPPTMKTHIQAAALKQSIMKMFKHVASDKSIVANSELPEKVVDDSEDKLDAEVILTLMFSNDHIDVNVIFEQAKSLFKVGSAMVDGEIKLTHPMLEKMSVPDFQNLTGEYIANFIPA